MKFLCSHCKAKYQIADEKVAGRTLRMICRNCQQEIVIAAGLAPAAARPERRPGALSTPAPSALAADFQRYVGGNVQPRAPSMAPIDEWHVAVNDSPVGPIRREEVTRMLAAGTITLDSLAWREGLDDWLPVRRIAELVPFMPGATGSPLVATSIAQPGMRADMAPIGGRGGAAPAYTLDEWAAVPEQALSHSQISNNPALDTAERRGPSSSAMFALAGGFAFLMTALAILGARWLTPSAPVAAAAVTAVAPPAASGPAPRAAVVEAEPEEESEDMVIELDDPGLATATRPTSRPRSGTNTPTTNGKTGGKALSAAEQEMLARMGGDTGSTISGLRGSQDSVGSARAKEGGLTSEQLSQVVMRGRKNLQRCYETALRGSGATDAVRLDVSVTVSAAGNVTNVKAAGQGLPGMNECIERTVRMWRFPDSGESTQTKFPVVFQPGG